MLGTSLRMKKKMRVPPWVPPLFIHRKIHNGYIMACPHIRGDNPIAKARRLSPILYDNNSITIFTTYIS